MRLPKQELYEEGSQLRRSSKAVSSLIIEGYGRRRYKNDYVNHLVYSHAECDETIFHIEMLLETRSSSDAEELNCLKSEYQSVSRRINSFIRWVEENL